MKKHKEVSLREFQRLIKNKYVQEYLKQEYQVSCDYKIPLAGGSNVDGSRYFIHPDLPLEDRHPVLLHERYEKAFREALGMKHDRAHALATLGEKQVVRDWASYKKRIVRAVSGKSEKLPRDFDYMMEKPEEDCGADIRGD